MDFECRSYSGRGMYGKSCLGITVESGQLGDIMACIVDACTELGRDADDDHAYPADVEKICEALRHMSQDSLGLGMIIYFPRVPYDDGKPNKDKDNNDD